MWLCKGGCESSIISCIYIPLLVHYLSWWLNLSISGCFKLILEIYWLIFCHPNIHQWWRDLFRCRIDLLNFSMGFNIIAPYMEFPHLNWYIAEWHGLCFCFKSVSCLVSFQQPINYLLTLHLSTEAFLIKSAQEILHSDEWNYDLEYINIPNWTKCINAPS